MAGKNKIVLVFALLMISISALIFGINFASDESGTTVTTGEVIKIEEHLVYDADGDSSTEYTYYIKYEDNTGTYHVACLENFFGTYEKNEIIEIKYKDSDYYTVYGNGGNYAKYLIYGGAFGVILSIIIIILKRDILKEIIHNSTI